MNDSYLVIRKEKRKLFSHHPESAGLHLKNAPFVFDIGNASPNLYFVMRRVLIYKKLDRTVELFFPERTDAVPRHIGTGSLAGIKKGKFGFVI